MDYYSGRADGLGAYEQLSISSSLDFSGIFRILVYKCMLDTPHGRRPGTHYRVEALSNEGDGRSWKVVTQGIWHQGSPNSC